MLWFAHALAVVVGLSWLVKIIFDCLEERRNNRQ